MATEKPTEKSCVPEECLKVPTSFTPYLQLLSIVLSDSTVTATCTKSKGKSAEKTLAPRSPNNKPEHKGEQKPLEHAAKPCGGPEKYTKYCLLIGVSPKTVTCSRTPTVTISATAKGPATATTKPTPKPAPPSPPKKPIGFVLRCTNMPKGANSYLEMTGDRFKLSNSEKQATVFNLDKDGWLNSAKAGKPDPIKCKIDNKKEFTCRSGPGDHYQEFGTFRNGNDKSNTDFVFMGRPKTDWKPRFNGNKLSLEAIEVY
ncbi:hypothetical protein Dda_6120 [Drechslerella dactyloides]|uniref:Uncharacterized protein n=1 Tax=Drechslerella dactyloides TaxID=74499 RepID=A0AAD6NIA5_DREDA|nr:hypothetical protein Dda_6120 [Drechslerella dactyloides]